MFCLRRFKTRHAKRLPVVKDGMRVMYIRDCAVEQKEL